MLTPLMVREVERNLLLWTRGRAAVMTHRRTTRPMRLLTRLVQAGHEVVVSHVLTILGGPMERMAWWKNKRRRPCIVRFNFKQADPDFENESDTEQSDSEIDSDCDSESECESDSDCEGESVRRAIEREYLSGHERPIAILGSVQNYRAIETFQRDYAY